MLLFDLIINRERPSPAEGVSESLSFRGFHARITTWHSLEESRKGLGKVNSTCFSPNQKKTNWLLINLLVIVRAGI